MRPQDQMFLLGANPIMDKNGLRLRWMFGETWDSFKYSWGGFQKWGEFATGR